MNINTLTLKAGRSGSSFRTPTSSRFDSSVPTDLVEIGDNRSELKLIPARFPVKPAEPQCQVSRIFAESYHSPEVYEERQCGSNVRRLLERLPDSELEGMKVLGIENKGFSYFGLVRALHTRDTDRHGNPRTTDKNWYHHVVMEKDGRIFDFDYGTRALTPTVKEYCDSMFFNDDKVSTEKKMSDYEIQVIDAREYLTRGKDTSTKVRLGEYLAG